MSDNSVLGVIRYNTEFISTQKPSTGGVITFRVRDVSCLEISGEYLRVTLVNGKLIHWHYYQSEENAKKAHAELVSALTKGCL